MFSSLAFALLAPLALCVDPLRSNWLFGNNFGIRLASAAFSVVISAAFLAYAIIPASPSLMA